MSVEAAVSLWVAWTARSPALLAFGGDSFIELFSAIVVFWRFSIYRTLKRAWVPIPLLICNHKCLGAFDMDNLGPIECNRTIPVWQFHI